MNFEASLASCYENSTKVLNKYVKLNGLMLVTPYILTGIVVFQAQSIMRIPVLL